MLVCAAEQVAPELVLGWRGEVGGEAGGDERAAFVPRAIGADARAAAVFSGRSATVALNHDLRALGAALALWTPQTKVRRPLKRS